jgi:flagellar hook-length control protein FliK
MDTMNAAKPLAVIDILNTASPGAPTGSGSPEEDLLDAASFAALLHIANFVADAPANAVAPESADDATTAEPAESGAAIPASSTDGLLLLSNVMPAAQPVATREIATVPSPSVPLAQVKLARVEAGAGLPEDAAAAASASPPAQGLLAPREPSEAKQDAAARALLASSRDDAKASIAPSLVPVATRDDVTNPLDAMLKPVAPARAIAIEAGGPTLVAPSSLPSQPAPATAVDIATPAFQPGWHEEAAHRIAALTVRGAERAELRLHPAELGPVELRIDVRDGEASVAIVATNAATRDALEQALPALRELLAQQNIALGEASVQDGRPEQAPSREQAPRGQRESASEPARTVDAPAVTAVRARRLVDVFA